MADINTKERRRWQIKYIGKGQNGGYKYKGRRIWRILYKGKGENGGYKYKGKEEKNIGSPKQYLKKRCEKNFSFKN